MFEKKGPKGIEGDKGGGKKDNNTIPVAPAKKPVKKKGKKPGKAVKKEGQKGKIAAMLGSKFSGKDIAFKGKGKTCSCKGDCSCNEKFEGGKRGQALQFVPEQKRMGIKG